MLLHSKTKGELSAELPVDPAQAGSIFEGQALSISMSSGVGVVDVTTGSGDVFAGFAQNTYKVPSTAKKVDAITVPSSAPYTVTLSYTPLSASTTMAVVTSTGTALAYNAGVGSGQFSVAGAIVTFNSVQAGLSYFAIYSYSLTVDQAQALFGDGYVYGKKEPSQVTQSVGCITRGIIYTDVFDPSSNWYGTIGTVYTGANGMVTLSSGGASINCNILAAPSVDFPYLGLYLK
jgi:hypothetical protein